MANYNLTSVQYQGQLLFLLSEACLNMGIKSHFAMRLKRCCEKPDGPKEGEDWVLEDKALRRLVGSKGKRRFRYFISDTGIVRLAYTYGGTPYKERIEFLRWFLDEFYTEQAADLARFLFDPEYIRWPWSLFVDENEDKQASSSPKPVSEPQEGSQVTSEPQVDEQTKLTTCQFENEASKEQGGTGGTSGTKQARPPDDQSFISDHKDCVADLVVEEKKDRLEEKAIVPSKPDSDTYTFEGFRVPTYQWDGRPCWLARDVGRALGYANDGSALNKIIAGRWRDEFILYHDYVVLRGNDLEEFIITNANARPGNESLLSRASSVLVLFEPGVNLVIAKTNKPEGKRMRRWMADEVLPQISRTGKYDPELYKRLLTSKEEAERKQRLLEAELERIRLDRDSREMEIVDRMLTSMADDPNVDSNAITAIRIRETERFTGRSYQELAPKVVDKPEGKSADGIARDMLPRGLYDKKEKIKFLRQEIGRAARRLGFKDKPYNPEYVLYETPGDIPGQRYATTMKVIYTPKAQEILKKDPKVVALRNKLVDGGQQLTLIEGGLSEGGDHK